MLISSKIRFLGKEKSNDPNSSLMVLQCRCTASEKTVVNYLHHKETLFPVFEKDPQQRKKLVLLLITMIFRHLQPAQLHVCQLYPRVVMNLDLTFVDRWVRLWQLCWHWSNLKSLMPWDFKKVKRRKSLQRPFMTSTFRLVLPLILSILHMTANTSCLN